MAQSACSVFGQTPPTAFPICALQIFVQDSVPICSTNDLFVPGCSGDGANYQNKNPFWYKFRCYQAGTLGFTITPNDLGDDYDWQLYDVTGLNPNEVFTNQSIVVAGNWSGTFGLTGASANGVNGIQCASFPGDNLPTFAAMPNLIVGHDYILLISHFSDSQSGYSLVFSGGTAVITDPVDPHLQSAQAPCDGTEIKIAVNKKMRCTSLAANGSDFVVTAPNGSLIVPTSAVSLQCNNGFDMDSISVFLANPLAPGTYTVTIKKGTDGNTLTTFCDVAIPENESVTFTVFPLFPTALDSITTPKCAPQTLEVVFKKKINCNTVDPAGGDFFITGPYPVTITAANTVCDANGQTNKITLQLSAPMQVGGTFLLNLRTGPDGNTITDECGVPTPDPSSTPFVVKDTVNANFTFNINYGCDKNVVSFNHDGANAVNNWLWTFTNHPNSTLQNPVVTYTNFENKTITLIVSNGVCKDTSTTTLSFANYLKAAFEVTPLICPQKPATFINNSVGQIVEWKWIMGNGSIINVKDPAPQFYVPLTSSDYNALPTLIIKNSFGCFDTTKKNIEVVYSCFIAVPSAFTPNGDGLNDFLYPLKAYRSTNLAFSIYNRFGQRVFFSTIWQNKWDGKFKGLPQDPGTYVWTLEYLDLETNRKVYQKGTSILIR
ncbi:gliding motility-associated C-terminal domain-containing protein [Ferruginibacter yonginensis]|uniref:Gliding motility-associated C-terminal domain-containing protein n=1 Tax=Ferruginibacter yonginensis TaxID=1310416 RepID=A0ABV8QRX5_9BACT